MTVIRSIILAGGIGTRLWPLSREYFPKQFLQLGTASLFQETYRRSLQLSAPEDIIIVTHRIHEYLVHNQIEELGKDYTETTILVEPEGKNTLPAIAWALSVLAKKDRQAVAAIFPSDHRIGDGAIDSIREAVPLTGKYLVTFGVEPTHPHTGYGYIRKGSALSVGSRVREFREKPDRATAECYITEGCLWNSGIFLFSAPRFFTELRRLQPALAASFAKKSISYPDLPAISVDYGLLERSQNVAVVPLRAAWSDLGDFGALYAEAQKDGQDNAGEPLAIDARGNYVRAEGKTVALIGVNNLAVVDTGDALLVARMDMTARVRDLVAQLKAAGDPVTEFHLQVHRPWGSYTVLENSQFYKIKRVTVKPGKKLSLQMHHHRSEHWIVVSGMAEIDLGEEKKFLRQGESTYVPSGTVHRLGNSGKIPLEVIEVEIGEYLDEADIVRFDDEYGRTDAGSISFPGRQHGIERGK